ncbi:hypothetical protein HDV03_005340 [Kappamyces sp. JEL0829]|nr:hypothetical protein HDV03_005340 [Kappamyces sp. JEL0829]
MFSGLMEVLQLSSHQLAGENTDFITLLDGKLWERGRQFRWASFNVPGLLMTEDRTVGETLYGFKICTAPIVNPAFDSNGYAYGQENGVSCIAPKHGESDAKAGTGWVPPTPAEQEDAILAVKGAEGRVIRTYTLGFGERHHVQDIGRYYEPAWVAMDHALALARKHQIRLVVPIVNNHNGGDGQGPGNFGDYWSLCNFRGLPPSGFYANHTVRQDLKDIISWMLNRRNTVNGILYKDDSTVLAWQLGNELGGWDDPIPPSDWSIEMASHIKSLAPHTLVMDATIGLRLSSRFPDKHALRHPSIDIFTNHYYSGSSDVARIRTDASFVASHRKAFVIGEFGFAFADCQNIYHGAWANHLVSGAMVWSLRYHSRDGGHYVHFEDHGYFSFHVPGFNKTDDGFGPDDLHMAKMVRSFGLKMKSLPSSTPYPVPAPPQPVAGWTYAPADLRWFGAAWAAQYRIYRKQDGGEYVHLAVVRDGVTSGTVLFSDSSVQPGHAYSYRITSVSVEGIESHQPLELSFTT